MSALLHIGARVRIVRSERFPELRGSEATIIGRAQTRDWTLSIDGVGPLSERGKQWAANSADLVPIIAPDPLTREQIDALNQPAPIEALDNISMRAAFAEAAWCATTEQMP